MNFGFRIPTGEYYIFFTNTLSSILTIIDIQGKKTGVLQQEKITALPAVPPKERGHTSPV